LSRTASRRAWETATVRRAGRPRGPHSQAGQNNRALWGERVQLMPDQNSKQRFETRATGLREAVSGGTSG
jgi:hypothetical protein